MIGIAGWALYIVALRLAPLSLVQAVSAGGLALLAVLAQREEGALLPRREWIGVGLVVVGLVFLSVSLAGGASGSSAGSWVAVSAWFLVSFVLVGHRDRPGGARGSPRVRGSASPPESPTPPPTSGRRPPSTAAASCCSQPRSGPATCWRSS